MAEISDWCRRVLGAPIDWRSASGKWTTEERQVAWAASLWIAAVDAKLSTREDKGEGFAEIVQRQAPERLRRAGA